MKQTSLQTDSHLDWTEIDLVAALLMKTNPMELRIKLQQIMKKMRHHALDEKAALHKTICLKIFAALSGLLSHEIRHVSKELLMRYGYVIAGHCTTSSCCRVLCA